MRLVGASGLDQPKIAFYNGAAILIYVFYVYFCASQANKVSIILTENTTPNAGGATDLKYINQVGTLTVHSAGGIQQLADVSTTAGNINLTWTKGA